MTRQLAKMNTNERHYLVQCSVFPPYTDIDMQPQTLVRQEASEDATAGSVYNIPLTNPLDNGA